MRGRAIGDKAHGQRGKKRWLTARKAAVGAGLLTGGVIAGGAVVAGAAIAGGAALARAAATPAQRTETPVEVVRIAREAEGATVWLRGQDIGLPGRYGLLWDGGHARLGEVVARSGALVARRVIQVDGGQIQEGLRGRITGWWFPSAAALARECSDVLAPEEVELALDGGVAPAWVMRPAKRGPRGRGARWAIHVHGRGALPTETLRGVAPLARVGVTSLVVSYRNDPGAPAGAEGRYGFGISEARDVDAAIAYALAHGATRVTLVGWSMGGTACLVAATGGRHRDSIDGLILDSPAVDWPRLLEHQARLHRAPGALAKLGMALLERGVVAADAPGGIDFSRATPEAFAEQLRVPTLIFASRGDTFVPSGGAERLAKLAPQFVQLRLVQQGEHVKIWNTDPEIWERITEGFARGLPRPAWRG